MLLVNALSIHQLGELLQIFLFPRSFIEDVDTFAGRYVAIIPLIVMNMKHGVAQEG